MQQEFGTLTEEYYPTSYICCIFHFVSAVVQADAQHVTEIYESHGHDRDGS